MRGLKVYQNHVAFWGSPFSNFHPCTFVYKDVEWKSSEQCFMAMKAKYFKDDESYERILNSTTPKEAKALGIETVIGKAPMHANARTKIAESERGFVKLVADKTNGKLLGAAMMCETATDMIMETVYGILDGKTPDELLEAVHPHPSFAEGIETALRVLKEKYR